MMADPSTTTSAGWLSNNYGVVNGVVGAGSALMGSWDQSQAILNQSTIQQRMAAASASLMRTQGQQALQRGATQADRAMTQGQGTAASIRTTAAAGGLDASFGAANNAAGYAEQSGVMDAVVAKNNAALAAFGYNVQATNTLAQGNYEASAAQFQAGSTLLTGGLRAAQDLYGGWSQDAIMANRYAMLRSGSATPFPNP